MNYTINKMDETDAQTISKWVYDAPYSIYDMEDTQECVEELLGGTYYTVRNHNHWLIGYYCFGEAAQVPIGNQFGAYDADGFIDIGLGINPDLCGQGLGLQFLQEGIHFAHNQFCTDQFRLTVATFNQRAIKVYERVGFQKVSSFERISEGSRMQFDVMIYRII